VKLPYAATPARLSALALACLLCGCSSINDIFAGDKVDYRNNAATKGKALEVPPDLTQLTRDSRYQAPGGVVSAAATGGTAARPAGVPAAATVALTTKGEVRVERMGSQRWLVVPAAPEKVWPQVKAFWTERGFTFTAEVAESGLLETDWAENRSKLPTDLLRRTLGRVVDGLYDTGQRDRYRTRVERSSDGSTEIYISHRGLEEVYSDERKDTTVWRPRPNDPALEAQMLTLLMVQLGTKEETARTAVAAAVEQPTRARVLSGRDAATLEMDEPFDRAWRRVGLALDRSGFSVEDRDRTAGVYYVRYVDQKAVTEESGFFSKLFSSSPTAVAPVKYRVAVKASGEKTLVSVLTAAGAPEAGDTGQRIVNLLVGELK
jgi:outer membrane protein assembly factor BamC